MRLPTKLCATCARAAPHFADLKKTLFVEPIQIVLSSANSADVRRLALHFGKTETQFLHEVVVGLMRQSEVDAAFLDAASDAERGEWLRFAAANLALAYGDDEPEYTLADGKVPNPHYREK